MDRIYSKPREYILKRSFQDEPINRAANLVKCNAKLEHYFRHTLEQGTSVMAIDTANGNKVVGVRAHRVERRGDVPKEEQVPLETDAPTEAVLGFLQYSYNRCNPWTIVDEDSMLCFKFLVVDKEYRGRNISGKMMELTMDYMRSEGIPVAYVQATSAYSQAVFKKLNFEQVDEILYEDYKVDGKVVFHPDQPIHKRYAAFIKRI